MNDPPLSPDGAREDLPPESLPETQRARLLLSTLLAILRPLWPWLILSVVVIVGWREIRSVDLAAVRGLVGEIEPGLILILLGATAINLSVFGLYDVAALGPRSAGPPFIDRWKVGVLSFAWSNFLTVGPLAGPALRLWLYRGLDVEVERARSALAAILAALCLSLGAWCGAAWLPLPAGLDGITPRLALGAFLGGLAAMMLRGLFRLPFAPAVLRGWRGSSAALLGCAVLDWLLAWGVFHLAVNEVHGGIDARTTLPVFFTGQLIGLLSFVPGGIGSADAYWLVMLAGAAGGHDRVLAALLLYRAVYYVLPWAVASLVLVGRMVPSGPRIGSLLRTVIASYGFLCGMMLLASAATPALAERAAFLRRTVPVALVEISHGASVVLGFLLLVVSRGLARGYRSSHRLALVLALSGALATFLKGLDYEEAILALVAAAVLLLAHRSFHREGRLRPPVEFVISVGVLAVVVFGALGFGTLASVPGVSEAFSHFGHRAVGARFLRALMLLAAMVAVAALHFTLRPKIRDTLPDAEAIDHAIADATACAASTNPLLVACGDKAIFRAEAAGPGAFIAYRSAGRFLIAYADPVSPPGGERGLLAAFLDHAATLDRDVVLYQITPAFLPVAHDFGFTFFKLGEEAVVDLAGFNLKGNKAKAWRHAINSVEREGGRFEIVAGQDLPPLLPELRRVSDAWLRDKHVIEKRFSLGRFDDAYLRRFPCALVRGSSGEIVGFANILGGRPGGEMSIDLMRYSAARQEAAGMHNVMEYLFLKLMLEGAERGCVRFNLGMAPLAAVGEERRARPFERLAHMFFRHGGHWYNYQGLRRYKEKFDPRWEPRYMAYQRPWDWPLASTTTAALIAGGWRALLFPGGERA